jgi:TatD DNase family protein
MIDIGANLASESFYDDIDEVLVRARQAHVEQIIVTGSSVLSSVAALKLARLHPGYLFSTAGIHPHEADNFKADDIATFSELLADPQVVAIGETGLDFNRNFSSKENQISAFETHLELATKLEKPLFLHERDAFETLYPIMRNHHQLCNRSVVHCFTGSKHALQHYLDLGCYIGITGWICDKKRGQQLREIIQYAPLDRLLIETDAPYLTPHKEKLQKQLKRKHRNEPWTLEYTAKALAEATANSCEKVVEQTTKNARNLFKL